MCEVWKDICVKSKYKVGDVMQFERKDSYCSKVIYVTKISYNRKRGKCNQDLISDVFDVYV